MRQHNFAVTLLTLTALGCSRADDFGPSREAIKQELRDPASAEFRNEAIRTLWTKGGQHLTIYCAEINSANAFGGKTGFKSVSRVLDQKNLSENVRHIWKIGDVNIYQGGASPNYYLNCVRTDTERSDANFGKAIAWFGDFDAAGHDDIDAMEPVLSSRSAP